MRILRSPRTWLFVGVLLACAFGVMRWRELRLTADLIERARDGLQDTVAFADRVDEALSPQIQEYRRLMSRDVREAIRRLDAAPPSLPSPIPVFAVARDFMAGADRPNLVLQWVENGFKVSGFYVIDSAGRITDCPGVFSSNDLVKRTYPRSGFRHVPVGIVTNSSDEEWWRQRNASSEYPPWLVRLPPGYFSRGDVRLGLLTNAGREPDTIPVRYLHKEDEATATSTGDPKKD